MGSWWSESQNYSDIRMRKNADESQIIPSLWSTVLAPAVISTQLNYNLKNVHSATFHEMIK